VDGRPRHRVLLHGLLACGLGVLPFLFGEAGPEVVFPSWPLTAAFLTVAGASVGFSVAALRRAFVDREATRESGPGGRVSSAVGVLLALVPALLVGVLAL